MAEGTVQSEKRETEEQQQSMLARQREYNRHRYSLYLQRFVITTARKKTKYFRQSIANCSDLLPIFKHLTILSGIVLLTYYHAHS